MDLVMGIQPNIGGLNIFNEMEFQHASTLRM